jgi:hypothetical protein
MDLVLADRVLGHREHEATLSADRRGAELSGALGSTKSTSFRGATAISSMPSSPRATPGLATGET